MVIIMVNFSGGVNRCNVGNLKQCSRGLVAKQLEESARSVSTKRGMSRMKKKAHACVIFFALRTFNNLCLSGNGANSNEPFLNKVVSLLSSVSGVGSFKPNRFLVHMDFVLLRGVLSVLVGLLGEEGASGADGGPEETPASARMSKLSLFFVLFLRPLRRKEDERRGGESESRAEARDDLDDCADWN